MTDRAHTVEAGAHPLASRIGLWAGPLLAAALLWGPPLEAGKPMLSATAAVAAWMSVWWMTEAVPLAVTSMLPVALFPLLGVSSAKTVAGHYFNNLIFLFIGGFLLALAMERWHLHQRIALRTLMVCGVKPRGILLGFILATGVISMWVSNTATTMMILPIALAVIGQLETSFGPERARSFGTATCLAIAYAASIGGVATLVGTPTNIVFKKQFSERFPEAPAITFASWMQFALPVSLLFLFVLWLYLSVAYLPKKETLALSKDTLRAMHGKLGRMRFEERVVLAAFALLVAAWLTVQPTDVGLFTVPGWSSWFPHPDLIDDSTPAIAIALLLFLIPAVNHPGKRILDWDTAAKLPWSILLLFGGGFALAAAFQDSGLSAWIGARLGGLSLPPLALIALVSLLCVFMTELTSNVATAQILLPILAATAVSMRLNPLLLMLPATLTCSLGFMLPVGTPPNAIVFSTGRVTIGQMARTGFVLNLIGVILSCAAVLTLARWVFGASLDMLPEWAH